MPTAAPLNVFQRLARTWDAVHPYNAAQACRVTGTFARAAVDAAWHDAVESLGLGRVRVRGRTYDVEPAGRTSVGHLDAGDGDDSGGGDDDSDDDDGDNYDLSGHFTAELNRPFRRPDELPFRPFARRQGDSTWLAVVYQHWVADSVSVRELLRAWLARLVAPGAADGRLMRLTRCRSRDVVAGWQGSWRAADTLLRLLRRYGDNRRVRKVHTFGPLDYPVRVRLFPAPPGLLPGLLAYARSRGAKLNDVFLAALAEACHRLVPAQQRPGRDDLAVCAVADLRPGLPPALRGGFGCLLGFTNTVCRKRDLDDWDRLLRSVAAQSRAQRDAGVGPASVLSMLAAELASRYTPPRRLYDLSRKENPRAAGISNVNLNGTWAATAGDARHPVIEYLRVSPTGPIVPVALAVTSLRDELRLALTYRTALLNDWTASELVESVLQRLSRTARVR